MRSLVVILYRLGYYVHFVLLLLVDDGARMLSVGGFQP